MKIGIMQPYFFPYLGYFNLLNSVDLFIVYDTVQYIRRGWMHRNRVFQQTGSGWQYILVPIEKAHQKTSITEVKIAQDEAWKERIFGQIAHYEKTAPFGKETINFVKSCLLSNEMLISKLNVCILAECAKVLGINFQYRFCSELDLSTDPTHSAEERILDICEFLGATEYINLPGGRDLYHPEDFKKRNLKLTFQDLPVFVYNTGRYAFEPNLSIVDVLMWNDPKEIKRYLDDSRNSGSI